MHDQAPRLYPSATQTILFKRSLLGVAIATTLLTQPAFAQSTAPKGTSVMEEVTVTAQRRTERSLDVPISITALGSEQLGQGDVQQLSDVMKLTPALRFDNTGAYAQPTIRGVGTAVVVAGGSSNVGVYTDGFYSPSPMTSDSELLNVESVQVLKGPQGTLFGRNSTGGAILVTTREPSSEESVDLEAGYSSYNTQRYQVYATGGASDALAFDIAGLMRTSDGYVDNIVTGNDTDGAYNNKSLRLGAKFEPTDRFTAILRYTNTNTKDDSFLAANAYERDGRVFATAAAYGANVATAPDEVSNGYLPGFNSETNTTQLTLKFDLDFALLTSYSQYREENGTHYEDFDMSELDIFHFIFDTYDKVITQEFLLSSTNDSRLQWTTGLFYFDNRSAIENNRGSTGGGPFFRNGGSSVDVQSIALFGDATYALRDDLYLTVGVRYSEDEVDNAYFLNPTTQPPTSDALIRTDVPGADDDQISPRVALRYEPTDSSSMYVSYTEGYKSGILNVGGGTLDGINVKPEEIKAYEIGYKYSAGSLMLDLSTYYYDYQDLQVASYVGATSIIRNAANSNIFGVEGQMRYAFTEQLEVNLGLAYTDAEYDDFDESQVWDQCLDPACGLSFGVFLPGYADASGKQMQHAPKFTGTLGVSYRVEMADSGSLDLSGTLYHTSDFYFDSSENYKQDAYDLLSLRAKWTDVTGHYSVALFGDNLTDEEYRNQVLPQFYGALSTWGAPRTFGITLGLSY